MENASKALIMAGSILMSILVISAVVFMYNRLTDIEQTKTDVDEASKIVDYGKKFEQYNKTIYGSELLSLANLQDDYNRTQTGEKGYTPITIEVTITRDIADTDYFSPANNEDISEILEDKKEIEEEIKKYEDPKTARDLNMLHKNRVVKYYSQLSNEQITAIYKGDDESALRRDIQAYTALKTTYTEFKYKRFKCENVEYGATGRVEKMYFKEI